MTSDTTVDGVTTSRTYHYDDDDRLLGYDEFGDSADDVTYAYDKDGYLTSKTDALGTTVYDYSSQGELLSVDMPRVGDPTERDVIEYIHGIGGQRLAKTVNGEVVEKYLWARFTIKMMFSSLALKTGA